MERKNPPVESRAKPLTLEAPPGFPPLKLDLAKEDHRMALQYASHADPTERRARIVRIQQSLEEQLAESTIKLPRLTGNIDKGKGHIFGFVNESTRLQRPNLFDGKPIRSSPTPDMENLFEVEESSAHSLNSPSVDWSPTVFRLGASSRSPTTGNSVTGQKGRKRPRLEEETQTIHWSNGQAGSDGRSNNWNTEQQQNKGCEGYNGISKQIPKNLGNYGGF